MIVTVESLSTCKCHGKQCDFCEDAIAVGRVYTQTEREYREGHKRIAFAYCRSCGQRFIWKMKIHGLGG